MAALIAHVHKMEDDKRTPEERLMYLSRAPAACPLTSCKMVTFSSCMLSHYYNMHAVAPMQQIFEAFDSQRSLLFAKMQATKLEDNICLGMLLYAGFLDRPETLPARRFLSIRNDVRVGSMEHLYGHLPVMIMLCRTTWSALLTKKIPKKLVESNNEKNHIYILWCVSANCLLKLFATITVYDELYSKSRSATRHVRNVNDSQDVNVFCPVDSNYLLLTHSDVASLLESRFKTLNIEVILHEKPAITPLSPTPSICALSEESQARAAASEAAAKAATEEAANAGGEAAPKAATEAAVEAAAESANTAAAAFSKSSNTKEK